MGRVHFGVDTQQVGQIRSFNEALVEHLLSEVVELVGDDPPLHSPIVISVFANDPVDHFGVPPDTYIRAELPLRWNWFLGVKIAKLIYLPYYILQQSLY